MAHSSRFRHWSRVALVAASVGTVPGTRIGHRVMSPDTSSQATCVRILRHVHSSHADGIIPLLSNIFLSELSVNKPGHGDAVRSLGTKTGWQSRAPHRDGPLGFNSVA